MPTLSSRYVTGNYNNFACQSQFKRLLIDFQTVVFLQIRSESKIIPISSSDIENILWNFFECSGLSFRFDFQAAFPSHQIVQLGPKKQKKSSIERTASSKPLIACFTTRMPERSFGEKKLKSFLFWSSSIASKKQICFSDQVSFLYCQTSSTFFSYEQQTLLGQNQHCDDTPILQFWAIQWAIYYS